MPDFNFEIDFWKKINSLTMSGHASMRRAMRVFPIPSIENIKNSHVYECSINESGIETVCVCVPWTEGRNLYYVISRTGLIITGWWNHITKKVRPSSKKIYEKR